MNTATDELTPAELAAHEHVTARHEELLARITTRQGALGDAADYAADLVLYVLMGLHDDDRSTTDSGAVVEFIDELHGVLHSIRAEAVDEHRRRTDGAMERRTKLLGLDEEGNR